MNDRLRNMNVSILSDNWYTLKKVDFEYLNRNEVWEHQSREAYDRGNGAVVLLYNTHKKSVILTRQFRMPTYLNKNPDGMMIEACAGLLDENDPKTAIIKEIEEETGYRIKNVEKIFESYMSPGSVTEILYFFIASYTDDQKVSEGGGSEDETENIEVLEYDFQEALRLVKTGKIKDAKTIMLLQYAQINLEDLLK
ncbi:MULTISPECIES: NUDIX domain-containing protein [unclassified Leeuwenhoekiella]|uniref:NUDIX domain-containing protein n=1 Tax=unclassified Leeuwenhoekiella TaxID=2615029 RepID=UPI000C428704|nr:MULTISPECIES: NUDIX domain-containing protein [unclassified Leeuwenhoekiella]MAW96794.1 GDP-mannose pyrophosphatase [Leeuwenhoekiella sp.]MBA82389.1 GDP-mannose pyrophosphatase [Leeuwenhoekiella sp.]|tara:strand:- start:11961 stop:12548 length:588 start_codon:yes stop_codon:yes gene_type:complete